MSLFNIVLLVLVIIIVYYYYLGVKVFMKRSLDAESLSSKDMWHSNISRGIILTIGSLMVAVVLGWVLSVEYYSDVLFIIFMIIWFGMLVILSRCSAKVFDLVTKKDNTKDDRGKKVYYVRFGSYIWLIAFYTVFWATYLVVSIR